MARTYIVLGGVYTAPIAREDSETEGAFKSYTKGETFRSDRDDLADVFSSQIAVYDDRTSVTSELEEQKLENAKLQAQLDTKVVEDSDAEKARKLALQNAESGSKAKAKKPVTK